MGFTWQLQVTDPVWHAVHAAPMLGIMHALQQSLCARSYAGNMPAVCAGSFLSSPAINDELQHELVQLGHAACT